MRPKTSGSARKKAPLPKKPLKPNITTSILKPGNLKYLPLLYNDIKNTVNNYNAADICLICELTENMENNVQNLLEEFKSLKKKLQSVMSISQDLPLLDITVWIWTES